MEQYKSMQTWYCEQEKNKAKSICTEAKEGKGKAKGPHPMFNAKHKHHKDWLEMSSSYCKAHESEGNSQFLCKLREAAAKAGKGKGIGAMPFGMAGAMKKKKMKTARKPVATTTSPVAASAADSSK